jgi:WD40 repeat protein
MAESRKYRRWSPAIAWHADGRTFAWESSRTRVSVVDLEDPAKRPEACENHTLGAKNLEFSPDGNYLAAFGPEKVNVWNWRAGGKPVAAPSGTIGGWLADSARLLLAGRETPGRIEIFDVSERRPAGVFDGHLSEIYALRPASSGGRFASAGADRTVRLWTLDDAPAQVRQLETPRGAKLSIAELSPDCRAFAAYSWDREQILVFDVRSGKRLRILPLASADGPVLSLAWSPDGAFLASSSLLPGDLGKGRLILWGAKPTSPLPREGKGRLILWDVKSGTQIRSIGGGAQLTNLSFSPDGSKLAARNQRPDSSDDAPADS